MLVHIDWHYYRLLDILAGRKGRSGISQKIRGSVLLNGERRPPNFKLITGYVVQVSISCIIMVDIRPTSTISPDPLFVSRSSIGDP